MKVVFITNIVINLEEVSSIESNVDHLTFNMKNGVYIHTKKLQDPMSTLKMCYEEMARE